jgi:5-methyltetrahydropteroyltriglutamate--homocysteine methyltransferase
MAKGVVRADHCGSFIRPARLRQARVDYLEGRLPEADLAAIEDDAILDVLKLQREAGLQIYSDGEFRRANWLAAISTKFFDGFEDRGVDFERYPFLRGQDLDSRRHLVPQIPVVVDKLRVKRSVTGDERSFLKKQAPGAFKITLPSPVTLAPSQYRAGISERAYPDWQAFFDDYTRLMAEEIKAIVDDGVTYVQVDAPNYSKFIVPERRQAQLVDQKLDPKRELETILAAENKLLRAAKRDGVTVAVHICLGTFVLGPQGPLGGGGSTYNSSAVAEIINRLEADTFLIEYSARSGELDSLRDAPKNKTISLGVINIRDPQVETVDDLTRKIEQASRFVPVERLSICPNCGFSGASLDAWVSEDIQRRKLEALVETARRVWN